LGKKKVVLRAGKYRMFGGGGKIIHQLFSGTGDWGAAFCPEEREKHIWWWEGDWVGGVVHAKVLDRRGGMKP